MGPATLLYVELWNEGLEPASTSFIVLSIFYKLLSTKHTLVRWYGLITDLEKLLKIAHVINGQMDKQIVYPHNGILFSHKKK